MTLLDEAARVSAHVSDVVINQDYSHGGDASSTDSQVEIVTLSRSADPVPVLQKFAKTASLVTLNLGHSTSLLHLLPFISPLSASAVVINVAYSDLSDALVLRSSAPYIIHSASRQATYDHAIFASQLARSTKKLVLHIFPSAAHVGKSAVYRLLPDDLHKLRQWTSTIENGSIEGESLVVEYETVVEVVSKHLGRPIQSCTAHFPASASPKTIFVTLGVDEILVKGASSNHAGVVEISVYRPFPASALLELIPDSARVIVLQHPFKRTTKWSPLFLDVVAALQSREHTVHAHDAIHGHLDAAGAHAALEHFIHKIKSSPSQEILTLGAVPHHSHESHPHIPTVPKHEGSYTKLLHHLFPERLEILNDPQLVPQLGEVALRPEYALGRAQVLIEERNQLVEAVTELHDGDGHEAVLSKHLKSLLSEWLTHKDHAAKSQSLGSEILQSIESHPPSHEATKRIVSLRQHFRAPSRWIIGSDAWSYDLGASGLHHLIASGSNVNILLIDNVPYTKRDATDPSKRKKDAGLYAMNHGDVFVASVAVYSSYSQALHAMMEADAYAGPSVVLAYLPYTSEDTSALDVLKETKIAVDSGYWPLYRWNPAKEDDPFALESDAIKADLQEFLDRQNHLSQLTLTEPQLAPELVSSLGTQLAEARKAKAKQAYADLLNSMDGPPLLVAYASDGGNAEKIAKRLVLRAKARGVAARLATMDSISFTEFGSEQNVAFVTSTAGQGEPPQNGRETFRAINAALLKQEKPFARETVVKYSVFAMGDSHYWPRPEDAGYYNKPGKDLDARLEALGAERMADIGLGDDQDADGPQTGYKIWEPLLWKALGVDNVEVLEAEPEPITNENIKIASNFLRGTIAEGLKDISTGALAPSDGQLTKFHGIYEQDDRDIRDERKDAGLEPAYSFMIRVRMPGGVCEPEQWLAMDRIADERGNGTFKLTTRQTFQFHGVIKKHLKPSIQAINRALLDTIAACGDVNR